MSILCEAGHEIFVEKRAGEGIGFSDEEFQEAGAKIIENKKIIFNKTQLIL